MINQSINFLNFLKRFNLTEIVTRKSKYTTFFLSTHIRNRIASRFRSAVKTQKYLAGKQTKNKKLLQHEHHPDDLGTRPKIVRFTFSEILNFRNFQITISTFKKNYYNDFDAFLHGFSSIHKFFWTVYFIT